MNKIREMIRMKRITYKLFLITSVILFSFAVFIYVTLYFFLPTFYEKYKTNQLQIGIEEMIEKSKELTFEEAKPLLTEYGMKNNALLFIQNNDGRIIYSPSIPIVGGGSFPMPDQQIVAIGKFASKNDSTNSYSITRPIQFQDTTFILNVEATLQPIDEASQVLMLFLPYIGIIMIIISIGSAYLYSRLITRPIIYINQGAQKMANLDFSEKIEVCSNDELGELSNSLNDMSINLQENMHALQKVNQQLKSDIEKERELEKKRREFFAIVSHELKTPLTTLKGHLEGMIYNIGPYKDRDTYLQKNFQTVQDMEKLIREMLSISKLEQHTFKPRLEKVNLSELIHTIIKKLEFFASQKDIQIIEQIPPSIFVYTDLGLLEKALKNIIHNSIMYSPSGEKVYVQLNQRAQHMDIQFQVMNTGVQIKNEDLQEIFKPFYRVEKSRNRDTGGSGLGLYLVQQVFEALSIKYNVKNIEESVQFSITIPVPKSE
ncbi:sensor histidine kinase [Bacillus thuringiensis]|uniref:histidine kinase n=1 Tax=Bacillus thuringiensis serovar andalousiensis TaxID=257985 RepID=A0A6H0TLI5_BACTU|nr:HAMP domain-containing sensor histidine kinase [Bacillus thuringiensis]QIW21195.1 HAMP domain-containing protein [Bacillus thuringiensis serovar andalousiensis]